ncbi:unnamed protein product [Prunus armeniaca]|uniref:Uncharacterized protein n=1 Tax=Prunus armeniaca TaxID=36596 RepID=A0A6J5WM52_PRUAR|nr:unnamed protein product [Prunus armeniaca]
MAFNHSAQQLISKIILTKVAEETQRKRKAPEEVGNGENSGSVGHGIDGINPQNSRSNFGVLVEEPVGLAGDEVGEEGGGWLSLNNKGKSRGRGRGYGWLLSWGSGLVGRGFLLAWVEGGEELGFWVHRAWDGGWLLDGFGWRVVVGWVWGLELEGGGHGGMERERERERERVVVGWVWVESGCGMGLGVGA